MALVGKGNSLYYGCPSCGAKPLVKCGRRFCIARRALARAARRTGDRSTPKKSRRADYYTYLESHTWRVLRAKALRRDGHRCRVKGCENTNLQVHHAKYHAVMGSEKLEWLHTVCKQHHEEIHTMVQVNRVPLLTATHMILGTKEPRQKNPKQKPQRRVKRKRGKTDDWKRAAPMKVTKLTPDEMAAEIARIRGHMKATPKEQSAEAA